MLASLTFSYATQLMHDNCEILCLLYIDIKSCMSLDCSVTINVVLTDDNGKPIDALISEKEIEESGGRQQLEQATGLSVASVAALDSSERDDENGNNTTCQPKLFTSTSMFTRSLSVILVGECTQ